MVAYRRTFKLIVQMYIVNINRDKIAFKSVPNMYLNLHVSCNFISRKLSFGN